jgi:Mg2+ and Co2+ transporter CorA
MRVLTVWAAQVEGAQIQATEAWPEQLPDEGYLWIACSREEFQAELTTIQGGLERLTGQTLVDLHVSDLLNAQLPSRFDYSSHYDLMVFRRLGQRQDAAPTPLAQAPARPAKRTGPPVLHRIDTSPVGFAIFDRVLLSVHPTDCAVREAYANRLLASSVVPMAQATGSAGLVAADPRSAGARGVPSSPADMMLRILSHMVDGYLDLRRELSRQLDHWQAELLNPRPALTAGTPCCKPVWPCTSSNPCAMTSARPFKLGPNRSTLGASARATKPSTRMSS